MEPAARVAMSPLWSALLGDAAALEMTIARVQQVIALFAVAVSLYFAVMVRPELGLSLAVFAGWALVWFTVSLFGMRRGWAVEIFAWVNPIIEILIPGYALLVLTKMEGAEYALGSWVPPQMFALFIAASILRLRWEVPLMMGCVASVEYAGIYWFVIHDQVGPDAPIWALERVQLVRMFTLLLMGMAGSGAVVAFRRMVGRAVGAVRSRELFGKYVLGDAIASGGMGTVFRAIYCPEGGFQRTVAIKRIHPHLARNNAFLERFRHEAELCARLTHPNIVAALDFGRVDESYFYAMEFIDGLTLKDVMAHRRLIDEAVPPAMICWLGRQVLEGLQYAHAGARDADGRLMHVVHRDLSPHNVLLDRSGQVKISDFGVARALRDAHDMHTTNLAGKPAYMAPEQLRKTGIDERADLWSFAVVLWEMLTNQRLFFRDSEAATMLSVLDAQVPAPTQIDRQLGRHWDDFFARALARDSDHRFQTAAGMAAALAALQEREGAAGPGDVARLVHEADEEHLPVLELEL